MSQRLHVLQRRTGQHAVTEIEDVSRSAARAPQYIVGSRTQAIERPEQERGIEIALNASIADRAPGLVEWQAPVDADDVASGFRQLTENRGRADAEVNQ